MASTAAPLIAVTIGDVTGVGPEVALKALAAESGSDDARYLLIGDEGILLRTRKKLGLNIQWQPFTSPDQPGRFLLTNPVSEPLPQNLSHGSPAAANAAIHYLTAAAQLGLSRQADAVVTAPVSKEAIIKAGHSFIGQTEFLAGLANAKRTAMMLLGTDEHRRWVRVVLATTHVPLRRVADTLSAEKIDLAMDLAAESCRLLKIGRSKIAVCGLNPHAGEGGNLGTEEQTIIGPAIEAARKKGLDVHGPLPADTVFNRVLRGDFDVVVAMYHDQGLAPLKMAAFDTGVNWTLGLPFIRTSPDHGTAYDIAGKGIASPSSMISALRLAKQLIG